jgi:hypothetical protein
VGWCACMCVSVYLQVDAEAGRRRRALDVLTPRTGRFQLLHEGLHAVVDTQGLVGGLGGLEEKLQLQQQKEEGRGVTLQ